MILKSVTIENMHNVTKKTYEFNGLTYFVGPNGAGKSTVLQAIQLALLGYIPGTSKTNEGIFHHSSGTAMTVSVDLEDGDTPIRITRTWLKVGAKITTAVDIQPKGYDIESITQELELPIFNFNAFMDMSANKLKDWFINFLPGEGKSINWKKTLTDALVSFESGDPIVLPDGDTLLEDVLEHNHLADGGIDSVRSLNTFFKGQLSAVESQIKDAEGLLRTAVHYEDIDDEVDEVYLNTLNREIAELRRTRDGVLQYQTAERQNDRLAETLKQYNDLAENIEDDPKIAQLTASIANFVDANNPDQAEYSELSRQISELESGIAADQRFVNTGGVCSYTKKPCGAIVSLISSIKDELVTKSAKIKDLKSKADEIRERISARNAQIQQIQQQQDAIRQRYRDRAFIQTSWHEVDDTYAGIQLSTIDEQIDAKSELYQKLSANLKYNQVMESVVVDKFKLIQDRLALKRWIKLTDANHMQNDLTVKPFEQLANKMDTYVQQLYNDPTITVKFNLSERSNSFSFGILRDNTYISFDLLSSGEKCIFTLALMACLIDNSASPLKLILVDDLLDHLDSSKINHLFAGLKNLKGIQVILAGVQMYTAKGSDKYVVHIK